MTSTPVANLQKSSEYDSDEENSSSNSEEDIVKIQKAIWDADDKDYWQTGILLEKGACAL